MGIELKSYDEAKEYFTRSMHTCEVSEVVLFHNQRDTVRKLMKEVAGKGGRKYVEKDLTTVSANELGGIKTDNKVPGWLKPALEDNPGRGVLLYLREFHQAPDNVKADVLNILIKKEVQSIKFPRQTLIVLGVQQDDDSADSISHTHTVRFFK
jgi:hypothetical protein